VALGAGAHVHDLDPFGFLLETPEVVDDPAPTGDFIVSS